MIGLGLSLRQGIWWLMPSVLIFSVWPQRLGDAFEPAKLFAAGLCAAALIFFGGRPRLPETTRSASVLGVLLLCTVCLCSHDLGYAIMGSPQRFQGALVYVLAALWLALAYGSSPGEQAALQHGARVTLALNATLLAFQWLGFDPLASDAPRPPGALGNAMIQAQATVLLCGLAWPTHRCARRQLWVIAMGSASLYFTGTRSVWFAAGVVAFVIMVRRYVNDCGSPSSRAHGFKRLAGMGLVGATIAWALFALRPESLTQRRALWESALSSFCSNLEWTRVWFGHGPDQAFVALTLADRTQAIGAGLHGMHLDRVHQWFLDGVLSFGLAGTAWFVAAGVWLLFQARVRLPERRMLLLSLVVWWLCLQTGFALTADRLLAALAIGFCLRDDAPSQDQAQTSISGWRASLRALVAVCLVALSVQFWLFPPKSPLRTPELALADFQHSQQLLAQARAMSASEQDQALAEAERALQRSAQWDPLRLEYPRALAQVQKARAERASAASLPR